MAIEKPAEGSWTAHYPELGTEPMSYEDSISPEFYELEREAILAIAAREGWSAKYRKRGGMFGVVEMWIEGRQMIEVLAPEMQAEYLAAMREMAMANA